MTTLTLTPIELAENFASPEDLTTALAGSTLGSNTGVVFENTGHELLVVQVGASSTTATAQIGTTVEGQEVPGIQSTLPASSIAVFPPFPAVFDKEGGTSDVEVDFGAPANVTGVVVLRIPGVV